MKNKTKCVLVVWDNDDNFKPGPVEKICVSSRRPERSEPKVGKLMPEPDYEEGMLVVSVFDNDSGFAKLCDIIEVLDLAVGGDGYTFQEILDHTLQEAFKAGIAHAERRATRKMPWQFPRKKK